MSPEFLQAFAPYMSGGTATPDDEHANILASIMGGQGAPQPNMSGLAANAGAAPEVRTKRTIGNVLHDLLTDHVDSRGVPVSEKIASLGDAFRNAARTWRGEDPIDTTTPMRTSREQQEEWQRQAQARDAFAALLTNPTPERLATLAKLAPDIASSYMTQQQTAQHQTAQEAHQNRVDDFNMSKPVTVGGNTYLTPKEGGGWDEHQTPLPPGYKYVTDGEGQVFVQDNATGKTIRQLGGPKPGVNKAVTVQGANGNELWMVGPNGEKIRTIGAAPLKGTAKAPAGDIVADTLSDMGITLSGAKDPVADLIRGSTSGTLERVASSIPAFFGDTTQGRKNIAQLGTISKAITFALANGKLGTGFSDADRNFIEQQGGKIDDPSVPIGDRIAAWQKVRERLRNRVNRDAKTVPPAASTAFTPEQARAELARRQGTQ